MTLKEIESKVKEELTLLLTFIYNNQYRHPVDKKNIFKHLYKMFKDINNKYVEIESFIEDIQNKHYRTYYDYLILSSYKYIYISKKNMYKLQSKIHDYIDKLEYLDYCLVYNHKEYTSIKTISLSIFIVDKLDLDIDLKMLIDYMNLSDIYEKYFYFYSLYLLLMRINVEESEIVNNFCVLSSKMNKLLSTINNQKS